MDAFNSNGGYALVMQRMPGGIAVGGLDQPDGSPEGNQTAAGTYIFGMEIVQYSGWAGDTLNVARWSSSIAGMMAINGTGEQFLGPSRAFIVEFDPVVINYQELNEDLGWQVLVMPISVPAPGVLGGFDFLTPDVGISEFAQLTHVADPENTEWVRYDEIVNQHLLRNSSQALADAFNRAVGQGPRIDVADPQGPPPPIALPPALAPDPVAPATPTFAASAPAAPTAATTTSGTTTAAGSQWEHDLGDAEDEDWPLSRAVGSVYQFRGVFGTYSHYHPAGTQVLPVFRVTQRGIDGGQPGRMDPAFVVDADPGDPGWPVRIHHTHRPQNYAEYTWQIGAGPFSADPLQDAEAFYTWIEPQAIYVALQQRLPVPIAAGTVPPDDPALDTIGDTRLTARLVMFPSGERPRGVTQVALGGSFQSGGSGSGQTAGVPRAVIDEVVFGDTEFGEGTPYGAGGQGARMLLENDFGIGSAVVQVRPHMMLMPMGRMGLGPDDVLAMVEQDAGLLRIGNEIVGYVAVDGDLGTLLVAAGGRGMLGSTEQTRAAKTFSPTTAIQRSDLLVTSS